MKKQNKEMQANQTKTNDDFITLDSFNNLDYESLLNRIKPHSIDLIFTSPPPIM